MRKWLNFIFILLWFGQWSCSKDKEFPIEPNISLSDKQTFNQPQTIIVDFTDGDGDIGLRESDTLSPYNFVKDTINETEGSLNLKYYNIYFYYYAYIDGDWQEYFPSTPYYSRVPYLTPSGQNKALKGEISVEVSFAGSPHDSCRFEIELMDRAFHVSNRIVTPTIYL